MLSKLPQELYSVSDTLIPHTSTDGFKIATWDIMGEHLKETVGFPKACTFPLLASLDAATSAGLYEGATMIYVPASSARLFLHEASKPSCGTSGDVEYRTGCTENIKRELWAGKLFTKEITPPEDKIHLFGVRKLRFTTEKA